MLLAKAIVYAGQDGDHQVVGYQLPVVYVSLGGLSQLGAVLDLVSQYVTRRDMSQSVLLNQFVALGTLTSPWRSENNDILHLLYLFIMLFCQSSSTMV